jgi:hypothetical protein
VTRGERAFTDLVQDGDVLAPLGGATCTADEDTRVVVPVAVSCSDAEADQFFAEGAAKQPECARNLNDTDIVSVHVGVDGRRWSGSTPGASSA